jgi:hypothetical protein
MVPEPDFHFGIQMLLQEEDQILHQVMDHIANSSFQIAF